MSNRNYIVLDREGQEVVNNETPLHPGYILEMEIDARGVKKQDIAKQLDILPQHLSEILKEKRHVSAILALKLQDVFDINAEYWLRVQSGYELAIARKKLGRV